MSRSLLTLMAVLILALSACVTGTDKFLWQAEKAADVNDYQQAITQWSAAIESRELSTTNLAKVYYKRGSAYSALGQYRQALADLDQALRLDPSYAKAYTNRGIVYNA